MNKKRLGLVLGSGGSRGAAHIGLLQALSDNGITPDCISGCSAGAVVGACFSHGLTAEKMLAELSELKKNDILDPLPLIGASGMSSTKRFVNKMRGYLGDTLLSELKIPFCCVATDIVAGKLKVFDSDTDAVSAVVASSCLPAIYVPIVIDSVEYIDGGMLSRLPIAAVRRFEPDIIVAVDVFAPDNSKKEYKTIISVLARAFELMDRDSTAVKTDDERPDVLIQPKLGSMSQYTFKGLDDAYYTGYTAGIESVDRIKELLS